MTLLRHGLAYLAAVAVAVALLPILSSIPAVWGFSLNSLSPAGLYVLFVAPFIAAGTILPYLVALWVLRQFSFCNSMAYLLAGALVGLAAYAIILAVFQTTHRHFTSLHALAQIAVVGAIAGSMYRVVTRPGFAQ